MLDLYSYIYGYDPDSTQRIAKVATHHTLSLNRCAEILELMAPVADLLGPENAVGWLKDYLEKDDLLSN